MACLTCLRMETHDSASNGIARKLSTLSPRADPGVMAFCLHVSTLITQEKVRNWRPGGYEGEIFCRVMRSRHFTVARSGIRGGNIIERTRVFQCPINAFEAGRVADGEHGGRGLGPLSASATPDRDGCVRNGTVYGHRESSTSPSDAASFQNITRSHRVLEMNSCLGGFFGKILEFPKKIVGRYLPNDYYD